MTQALKQTWQQFLADHSAHQDAVKTDSDEAHFGNLQTELNAAAQGNILVDLSHRGLLKLSGDDAINFLQGQVTNDVKLLDGLHSQYAGYCNAKGRLLALFFAFLHEGAVHLQLERNLLESIMKRLKMYVMRAKVTIGDESDQTVRIGIAGAQSESELRSIFGEIPETAHKIVRLEQATIIRLPSNTPAFMLITSAEQAISIWKTLEKTHTVTGKLAWDWLEVQGGLPEIVLATQEAFVPQMINLDSLGGINFKKGCYTGQEIVARTHYLGKVKRRMQLAHIQSEKMPDAGDDVTDSAQQIIGQIVRSSPALVSGFDVLVECRLESLETGAIYWQNHTLLIKSLPYTL